MTEPAHDFASIFTAHRTRVHALCLHVTGHPQDAEDATQETFLVVHRTLPLFRGESELSTWLFGIALRCSWSVRARRRPVVPLSDALVDSQPAPDEVAGGRLEAKRVVAAIDALSEEHRTVLALFAVEGLRHPQIAEILGIPEGTVWSRLHAARRRLADSLG